MQFGDHRQLRFPADGGEYVFSSTLNVGTHLPRPSSRSVPGNPSWMLFALDKSGKSRFIDPL